VNIDAETRETYLVVTSDDRGTARGSNRSGVVGRYEVRIIRSLGWEVWRNGAVEPEASFTFWSDADEWGRRKFPNVGFEVRLSKP
jgi:hypothetical protein